MTADAIDLVRHSVTRNDKEQNGASPYGGVWNIWVGPTDALHSVPGLPPYWSRGRDFVLSTTPQLEDMWASAVYKAKTKTASLGWEMADSQDSQLRVKRAQQLLLHFDGKRYVPGFQKVLDDFLLTDNGAFVEVVRATQAAGSRIIGLMHLDSLRCWRTGDVQRPIVYQDAGGREHILRAHQVLDFVDEPSSRVELRGVGRCGASRAMRTIIKLAGVEIYFREKVTGERNLAIHLVNGVSDQQLKDAIATGREDNARRGYVYYKGSLIMPFMGDVAPSVVTIPLAEVPDGFDVELERKDAYLRYANALGVPVQDIQPLSGQGLGTGTQTIILSEEAEGQGLAAFRKDWEHAINEYVLPESTTFTWTNSHDTRDRKAKAEADKAEADVVMALLGTPQAPGIISDDQALNMAVDKNLVPREFLPATGDQTPGGALADDEKVLPEAEAEQAQVAQRRALPAGVPVQEE